MRLTLGSLLAVLALSAGPIPSALAQQPLRPNPAGPRNPQTKGVPQGAQQKGPITQSSGSTYSVPTQEAIPEEELPEDLEELLREWEAKSSQIKSLAGKHKRTMYNLVFQEEKISEGKFYLETPDKGRIDLTGIQPDKGEKSGRIGKDGKPFKLVADRGERWICTGDEIVMVNDEEKTYEVLALPPEAKGKNIVNTPLPFLFGMKAADAKRRFRMTLKKNTPEAALLIVSPKFHSDQQNYVEAWVMLEKANYLPTAVKMFDPSGSIETVYKFDSVKINDRNYFLIFPGKDPFRLDFKRAGYTLVLPPSVDLEDAPRNGANAPRTPLPGNQRPFGPDAPRSANGIPRSTNPAPKR